MSYQEAHVAKADADVVIEPADLPAGIGGVTGYDGYVYETWQNIIKIANTTLDAASSQKGFCSSGFNDQSRNGTCIRSQS